MKKYKVYANAIIEIEIEAKNKEEAVNKVWENEDTTNFKIIRTGDFEIE